MRAHRDKGEFLQIVKPEGRGRKRKLQDPNDQKIVKKMLKKRKATPAKVAKELSVGPHFKGTVSPRTIYRNMGPSSGNRNLTSGQVKRGVRIGLPEENLHFPLGRLFLSNLRFTRCQITRKSEISPTFCW